MSHALAVSVVLILQVLINLITNRRLARLEKNMSIPAAVQDRLNTLEADGLALKAENTALKTQLDTANTATNQMAADLAAARAYVDPTDLLAFLDKIDGELKAVAAPIVPPVSAPATDPAPPPVDATPAS